MPDFLTVLTKDKPGRKGGTEIYPAFLIRKSRDLMIRGQDFYAVWLEDEKRWSTDEQDALDLIDRTLDEWRDIHEGELEQPISVLHTYIAKNGVIDDWHRYVMRQMRDNFKPLNEKIIFANQDANKTDYSSMKLPYSLQEGPTDAWDKLFGTLYLPSELHKLEWAIGSVATGASKELQKFFVLYGDRGTGKGTFLKVLGDILFPGYAQAFAAQSLGQANNAFPLQDLKDNPLIAIDMDGKLNRIEDNTRLNTLVSHEKMTVNLKGKQSYEQAFKTIMFIGSNDPVKITNAKSGLLRRLIDVNPSGQKVTGTEYKHLMKQIPFEAGAIVSKCIKIFEADPTFYDDYIPEEMVDATNDFYAYVQYQRLAFEKEDGTTLQSAWNAYKEFCEYAKVQYPLGLRAFKEELKDYFLSKEDIHKNEDGSKVYNYYAGFIRDKFQTKKPSGKPKEEPVNDDWLVFSKQPSIFDAEFADCPAQYAEIVEDGSDKPQWNWEGLKVTLSMLDTRKLHYMLTPWNLITIDFDIPDENGKKNFALNKAAVLKYGLPPTYAELSKSGQGIHLEYYYDGDPQKLSSTLGDHVEIKVRTGGSSLRRMLTKCNGLPIAHISGGLPLKEANKKTVTKKDINNSKHLRTLISKALNRQLKDGDPEANHTKTNIDFIDHLLAEAQEQNVSYDLNDMFSPVLSFAAQSTNNALYCMKLVRKMKFVWPEPVPMDMPDYDEEEDIPDGILPIDQRPIAFFDVEVFQNLFIICWKEPGEDKPVHRMINPTSAEVEALILNYGLIGFNNRKYDNHILLAASQGYSPMQLYKLSKAIISDKQRNHLFKNGYGISKTDLYDLSSKKQSLKKYEIELSESGVPHKELGMDWDAPVPEDMWDIVADYCCNDVRATEAVYNCKQIQGDLVAREILANITGMKINDTTNQLTTKFIFGNNRAPQDEFNYRNLAEPVRP